MRMLICAGVALVGFLAGAATVGSVTLSQVRGVDTKVTISYELSDVEGPQDVTVRLTREGEPVAIPEPAWKWLTGEIYGVKGEGTHTITLDPSFFPDEYVAGLRAEVTCAPQSEVSAEVLYRIFDLAETNVTDVTRGDFFNGSYGAFETNYSAIASDFVSAEPNQLIWTGVTNDIAYKTTKLVMRRIPAGAYHMRASTVSATPYETSVTFAGETYMAVFETTRAQVKAIGYTPYEYDEGTDTLPANYLGMGPIYTSNSSYADYKTRTAIDPATTKASDTAILKRLQYMFKEKGWSIPFDLPTQAQWQRAFYAGATSVFYDGATTSATTTFAQRLGRLLGNVEYIDNGDGTVTTNNLAVVGSYLPNAWGLYDMLGNVREWTCDIFASAKGDWDKVAAGGENLTGWRTSDSGLSYGRTGTLGADYSTEKASKYFVAGFDANSAATEQAKNAGDKGIGFRLSYYVAPASDVTTTEE